MLLRFRTGIIGLMHSNQIARILVYVKNPEVRGLAVIVELEECELL